MHLLRMQKCCWRFPSVGKVIFHKLHRAPLGWKPRAWKTFFCIWKGLSFFGKSPSLRGISSVSLIPGGRMGLMPVAFQGKSGAAAGSSPFPKRLSKPRASLFHTRRRSGGCRQPRALRACRALALGQRISTRVWSSVPFLGCPLHGRVVYVFLSDSLCRRVFSPALRWDG